MNTVSILMPVKNASPFLKDCLDSILNQTWERWELIAVDDHSSDSSKEILNEFAHKDPRIKIFTNQRNGIIPALQLALSKATGTYITRMDADDLMVPDRLGKMVTCLDKANNKTIVTGLVKYFSEEPVSEGYLKYEKWINYLNLSGNQWDQVYRECVIASPNWMVHRNTLEEMDCFDQLNYPEDYHLVLKWHQQNMSIITVPEVTLLWREHTKRTSRTSENYNQKAFFKLKINHFIENDLKESQLVLWGNNEKTRLTIKILNAAGVGFKQFDITSYQETSNFTQPQILVGVHPDTKERKKIEAYLSDLSLHEGKDWWYI
ncbi:MAG: glycosyltransferase family 2 protein [Bacteroidota bacterium]